jgi:hypothetical protein
MKKFETVTRDVDRCKAELDELKKLLIPKKELSEKGDLVPFFIKNLQITTLIGEYCPDLSGFMDEYAFEFPIKDDFTADIVLRSKKDKTLLFIELEEAKEDSVFKKRPRYYSEWGKCLEHGYSQIVDWFWKLSDFEKTDDFAEKIGKGYTYHGLLIVGRNDFVDPDDFNRLKWRFSKTVVNSKYIKCITYDQLIELLENKLS